MNHSRKHAYKMQTQTESSFERWEVNLPDLMTTRETTHSHTRHQNNQSADEAGRHDGYLVL